VAACAGAGGEEDAYAVVVAAEDAADVIVVDEDAGVGAGVEYDHE